MISKDRASALLADGEMTEEDLHRIFAHTPHPYLALTPDFMIVGANDPYLEQTLTNRADIIGMHLFDVFPDNPATPEAHSVQNLDKSLRLAKNLGLPHYMGIQRYDVRSPEGSFVERYWKPSNYPVIGKRHAVVHLLHHVQDVTRSMSVNKVDVDEAVDYIQKAQHCGRQAARCESRELRRLWMDMECQYLELAAFNRRH